MKIKVFAILLLIGCENYESKTEKVNQRAVEFCYKGTVYFSSHGNGEYSAPIFDEETRLPLRCEDK